MQLVLPFGHKQRLTMMDEWLKLRVHKSVLKYYCSIADFLLLIYNENITFMSNIVLHIVLHRHHISNVRLFEKF